MKKQELFNNTYESSRGKGFTPEESLYIAKEVIKDYKELEMITGKKSYTLSGTSTSNVIDMVFGYPAADVEEELGILKMDYSGWNKTPNTKLKGDLEHFSHDLAEGITNDLDESWYNFYTEAEDWYIDDKGNLRAKVTFPDTEKGREALTMYNTGQLGASIEYKGYKENNEVKNWEIIGYSLVKDPSYNTKSS